MSSDCSQALDGSAPSKPYRWSARRKAEVVMAIRSGWLSEAEAYLRYDLSPEELASWEQALDEAGMIGLEICGLHALRRPRVDSSGPSSSP
jgi:hypothetical protein